MCNVLRRRTDFITSTMAGGFFHILSIRTKTPRDLKGKQAFFVIKRGRICTFHFPHQSGYFIAYTRPLTCAVAQWVTRRIEFAHREG
ncbi:Uncharacterised protein [Vibrio cholerae]|nr:Uncharacterised protein [Vibrio cholerae]CSB62190.1 Uncharacterised protein [Vibrio cholerae]